MKKTLLATLLLSFFALSSWAAKTMYKPNEWTYNSSTQGYYDSSAQVTWYKQYSKETDNCILFWDERFGSNPKSAPSLNGTDTI